MSYETISGQLLELLDTLHKQAAALLPAWAAERARGDCSVSPLWTRCWCPALQGMARLSCARSPEARMHALQRLQRALLAHELQRLAALEWEACFHKVLFPLLAKLLEGGGGGGGGGGGLEGAGDAVRVEETRMRASALVGKVFLQHLTTLARLSTFTALWLTILDFMDKYMRSDRSDLLVRLLYLVKGQAPSFCFKFSSEI